MARMIIWIEDPGSDPTLVDPHNIAEDLVAAFNDEWRDGDKKIEFTYAEWAP